MSCRSCHPNGIIANLMVSSIYQSPSTLLFHWHDSIYFVFLLFPLHSSFFLFFVTVVVVVAVNTTTPVQANARWRIQLLHSSKHNYAHVACVCVCVCAVPLPTTRVGGHGFNSSSNQRQIKKNTFSFLWSVDTEYSCWWMVPSGCTRWRWQCPYHSQCCQVLSIIMYYSLLLRFFVVVVFFFHFISFSRCSTLLWM